MTNETELASIDEYDAAVTSWSAELDNLKQQRAAIDDLIAIESSKLTRSLAASTSRRQMDDLPPSPALVRDLYWNQPTIHVDDIARATNLDERDVRQLAGTGHFEAECIDGCGTLVIRNVKSRSEARKTFASQKSIDPRRCPDCREARKVEENQRHREQRDEVRTELDQEWDLAQARIQALREAGIGPIRRYVEYPGIGGTYIDPDFTPDPEATTRA